MTEQVELCCQVCAGPLDRAGGRPGRDPVYCSAACRQRAYRQRHAGDDVPELIADLRRRIRSLQPQPADALYRDASELSVGVGRLRRIARIASESVTDPAVTIPDQAESVTDPDVTNRDQATDGTEFAADIEQHRRELQVHCYRMVGSYNDAEDLVQETMLKAWRSRAEFQGRSSLRAWLYRIATNVCLDFLRRHAREPSKYQPVPGLDSGDGEPPDCYPWLQPFPDPIAGDPAPDAAAQSTETLELVFLTAIQHLPPRQRAVLMLRDVLDFSAADTAAQLDMTVPAVNSALQRARPTLRERLPDNRSDWQRSPATTIQERDLLARYIAVAATGDLAAMREMMAEDVVLTMPPNPFWFVNREAVLNFITPTFDPASPTYFGQWRHLPIRANGQPAAAGYVRRPGTTVYRPQTLDVLRLVDGRIAEITTFEPHLFPAFGLPMSLPSDGSRSVNDTATDE